MSLVSASVCASALFVIQAHSLSTEDQEVMGLLLGHWSEGRASVLEALPLCRSDRRKDRVEVDGAQLAFASELAEEKGLKVIGWYHSHPHITAAPSAVDARTQGAYQRLDSGFLGIICAAFQQQDGDLDPSLKVVAFQSQNVKDVVGGFATTTTETFENSSYDENALWRPRELPLEVLPSKNGSLLALRALAGLQDNLLKEELSTADSWLAHHENSHLWNSFHGATLHKGLAFLAADSLHPLLHVAATKLIAEKQHRDILQQKRDALYQELSSTTTKTTGTNSR